VSACGVCGAPLERARTGRPRVYCGDACRQRACRAARPVTKPSVLERPEPVTKLDAELRTLLKRARDKRVREILAAQLERDRALFREVAA
jgi:hypothetical protein